MPELATKIPRIALIDMARGIALIAMAVFHFNFDLELSGLVKPGHISQPHWVNFARVIAASFLMLVGFSLALSHMNGIRWRGFWIRFAKVTIAALIITIATYFATPDMFIFFGILHEIALASLLGLLFLRLPWGLVAVIALFVLISRDTLRTELLDAPIWWWSGLSQIIPRSSDYEPIFPWFGWVLAGISAAKLSEKKDWLSLLAKIQFDEPLPIARISKFLQLLGRNSLLFYLAHQPIMIALIYVYLQIAP
ncbi:MAG: DUF1624 domain-containing protein [Rhizobiaceae bacterium]|nr:DUF1624 domain-containing protein [Rhizobiaceae bacterium]